MQVCTITQTGGTNTALVDQSINQNDGATQTGTQTATVTQGPAGVKNVLQLKQSANQLAKTGSVVQNAYQTEVVSQTATGTGANSASSNQSHQQKALVKGTNQSQDTTANGSDCSPTTGPNAPNICADIQQHAAGGSDSNNLRQAINQDENSANVVATQSQGQPDGGLDGHVHQDTVSGHLVNVVNQSKRQHQQAGPGSSQSQWDPISCCGFASQFGGSHNKETINQSSALNSGPGAFQRSEIEGTSRTPDGTCVVSQHASVNGARTKNSDTVTPCPFLTLDTSCTSGSTDASVNGGGSGSCEASPPDTSSPNPPISSLSKQVSNNNDTYGTDTTTVNGGTLSYEINYSNSSDATGTAHNVVITDPIPAGTTYNTGSCSPGCTVSGGTITWNLGDIPPDGGGSMFFQVTVTASPPTVITNTASGHDDDEAPFSSNPTTATVVPPIG